MLAGVLQNLKQIATQPCYLSSNMKALAKTVTKNIKVIVEYLENRGSKFLVGNYVTYVDFILFELCDLFQFITDGSLITDFPVI